MNREEDWKAFIRRLEELPEEVERRFEEMVKEIGMEKYDETKVPEKCKQLNDRDWEAVLLANYEIQERTAYGVRRELAQERSTKIFWSDAAKKWCVEGGIEKGRDVALDANEVIVPKSPLRMERVVECLIDLPLYALSTEAGMRKEVEPQKQSLVWAYKQMERVAEEAQREALT